MASVHPSQRELAAYGLGKLDDARVAVVGAHLEGCISCRRRVAEAAPDSFLDRLRDARDGSPTGVTAPTTRTESSGAAVSEPSPSIPPELAEHPDYRIIRELGRGGMGVVYLAHNRLLGRDEVLKVMGPQIIERTGVFDRFQREIRAVASLRHPNIVTAYTAFRAGGGLVFAMEFVDGVDLARLIKLKGPLPVMHAAYFTYQAALGLQHAHERGMVHRDIKPHNLMHSAEGKFRVIKILDFGLAKATREGNLDGGLTREGQALGTPDYVAPEQIVNAPEVDVRADIYSLGCSLYFLLAGRPPFQAKSLYDLFQAHLSRDAGPLDQLRPDVPSELSALVAKMMAKDPESRFQTPADVAQALTPFFKKSPKAALRPAPPPPPQLKDQQSDAQGSVELASTRSVVGPKAPASPEVMWASLIDFRETMSDRTGQEPATTPKPDRLALAETATRKRITLPSALAVGAALLAIGLLWFGWQLLVRTPHGVIRIDNLPADAVVTVDGKEVKVAWTEGGPGEITVAAGPRGLEVRQGSAKIHGATVTVEAGKTFSVHLDKPESATSVERPQEPTEASSDPETMDTIAAQDVPPGFAPLFNGRDLTGWHIHPSQAGNWRVENGVLVGSCEEISHLYSDRDYKDFHLFVEAKINAKGDGGVLFRSTNEPARPVGLPLWPDAFEAEINSTSPLSSYRTGTLYLLGDRAAVSTESPPAADRWFTMEVIAQGAHIEVKIDGRKYSEFPGSERPPVSGHIALQVFHPESRIEFRKIAIKELTPTPELAAQEAGFVPLFTGHDLTGWQTYHSQPGDWRVENGVLVGSADGISHLYSVRGDYKDFHLIVEARINNGGDSGVFVRSTNAPLPSAGTPSWPDGYEAQINSTGSDPNLTGCLHIQGRAIMSTPQPPPAPDKWFTMEVIAEGNRIRILVDGRLTTDFVDKQRLARSGHIALQVHDWQSRVEFRQIAIKELLPGVQAAVASTPRADGFATIFNGRDLTGWKVDRGEPARWRAQEGNLIWNGSSDHRDQTFLLTDRDYKDFTLRFEFQMEKNSDGGVVFWAVPGEQPSPPEVNLRNFDEPPGVHAATAALRWSTDGRAASYLAPSVEPQLRPGGAWNAMEVELRGDTLKITVNDVPVQAGVDLSVLARKPTSLEGLARRFGRIGFQCHSGTGRIRNVEISELDFTPAAVAPAPAKPASPAAPPARPTRAAPATRAATLWPADAWEFRGAHFKVFPERLSWPEAVEACRRMRGRLVMVPDADANEFLLDYMREENLDATWLGATDADVEGDWRWLDGSRMTFSAWAQDQPTNRSGSGEVEHCLTLTAQKGAWDESRWNDVPGHGKWEGAPGFICEWPAPPAPWPADAKESRGIHYKLFPQKRSWHQAVDECRKMGGRLVVIHDAAEDQFVRSLLKGQNVEATWIGAADEKEEGNWVWLDGSPMTYANWSDGQPNNKGDGEHYAVLIDTFQGQDFGGQWSDQPNVSKEIAVGFVCQWPTTTPAKRARAR